MMIIAKFGTSSLSPPAVVKTSVTTTEKELVLVNSPPGIPSLSMASNSDFSFEYLQKDDNTCASTVSLCRKCHNYYVTIITITITIRCRKELGVE